jgi:hypothetical protein
MLKSAKYQYSKYHGHESWEIWDVFTLVGHHNDRPIGRKRKHGSESPPPPRHGSNARDKTRSDGSSCSKPAKPHPSTVYLPKSPCCVNISGKRPMKEKRMKTPTKNIARRIAWIMCPCSSTNTWMTLGFNPCTVLWHDIEWLCKNGRGLLSRPKCLQKNYSPPPFRSKYGQVEVVATHPFWAQGLPRQWHSWNGQTSRSLSLARCHKNPCNNL